MSLKAIHIVFVTIATLISAGFSYWTVQNYLASSGVGAMGMAALAVVMTVGLPVYGVWFLKKTKHVGYV